MNFKSFLKVPLVITLASTVSGCFGISSAPSGSTANSEKALKPVAEALIEYTGPQPQWVGPQSLSIRISTLSASAASSSGEVTMTPPFVASHSGKATLALELTRDLLNRLNASLVVQDSETRKEELYTGCLLPVRVKLTHTDGTLTERVGCRSQLGWPKVASEIAEQALGAVAISSK